MKKLALITQVVGTVTLALLAAYGLLALLGGSAPFDIAVHARDGAPQDPVQAASAPGWTMPQTMNYQGFLREPDGSLTTGTYTITARIYVTATGGTAVYETTVPNVTVRDGMFNIVLGDDPALPAVAFSAAPRYIGISLNTDPELIPRQRLHAVPWAMTATTLVPNATIDGLSGNVAVNGALGVSGDATVSGKVTAGAVVVSGTMNVTSTYVGNLHVSGALTATAVRDVGDSMGSPITRETYEVSLRRYVVEAEDAPATPDSVPVDDALLTQLCGDEDGCRLWIGARNHSPYQSQWDNVVVLAGPWAFGIGDTIGDSDTGERRWWIHDHEGGTVAGIDGDNSATTVQDRFDCWFSDDSLDYYVSEGDVNIGFSLLNGIDANWPSAEQVCILVIED